MGAITSPSPLYAAQDIALAKSNLLFAAAHFLVHQKFNNTLLLPLSMAHFFAMNYQRWQAYRAIPEPNTRLKRLALRPYANPVMLTLPLPVVGPVLAKSHFVASTYQTGRYTLNQLKKSVNAPLKKALPAVALHSFNLLSQFFCLFAAWKGVDSLHHKITQCYQTPGQCFSILTTV